ncbi:hypothetical protein Aduo_005857 [Ancylostoma duodenale]
MSLIFDPIKIGVKAEESTLLTIPHRVYEGVSKVYARINNAAKLIIHPLDEAAKAPAIDTDRAAAVITDDVSCD